MSDNEAEREALVRVITASRTAGVRMPDGSKSVALASTETLADAILAAGFRSVHVTYEMVTAALSVWIKAKQRGIPDTNVNAMRAALEAALNGEAL